MVNHTSLHHNLTLFIFGSLDSHQQYPQIKDLTDLPCVIKPHIQLNVLFLLELGERPT
jgi:hypothetical protein